MRNKIAAVLAVMAVLGLAAPASAQMYGGGWWGGPYRSYSYHHYYNYYPRHHFFVGPRHHFYAHRSWWGGY